MSFLDRMRSNRKIPSGPSHRPHQQNQQRGSHGVQAFSSIGEWWEEIKSAGYYPNSTYVKYVPDKEIILDGRVEISLSRGDILVIPSGRIDEVPEKYRGRVVEVPNLFDFSVIS